MAMPTLHCGSKLVQWHRKIIHKQKQSKCRSSCLLQIQRREFWGFQGGDLSRRGLVGRDAV
jgi:hypothetical protein